MVAVRQTEVFASWLRRLRDLEARARLVVRMQRLASGNAGDAKPVGDGVMELRIHHGPGYRVYFIHREQALIVLLCGGDKSTQTSDIQRAKSLAAEVRTQKEEPNGDPNDRL
jgi:putative addiction module killer protein